jgi:hypothetical protein
MFLLDEPSRVPGDHQIFVCRHDANRHRGAVAGDDPRVRHVAIGIEPDAEKLEALADALPDGCRVLADAARENEGVEPAKSSGQSPQKLLRLVTEESDRLGGAPSSGSRSSKSRMSALVPETPRRPARLLRRSLTSVGFRPRSSNK